MIVVTWNIRGLNKAHKQKELKNFLLKNKVDILGCIETRVKEPKAHTIINKIAKGWKYHLNYPMATNGRIWLLWRAHIQLHILGTTDQFIHCSVEDSASAVKFQLSVIYAYNTIALRKQLWNDLRGIPILGQDVWLLSGDFNVVLSTEDRIGSPVTDAEVKDFKELIYDLQLTPIRSKGWRYSWTNKQV